MVTNGLVHTMTFFASCFFLITKPQEMGRMLNVGLHTWFSKHPVVSQVGLLPLCSACQGVHNLVWPTAWPSKTFLRPAERYSLCCCTSSLHLSLPFGTACAKWVVRGWAETECEPAGHIFFLPFGFWWHFVPIPRSDMLAGWLMNFISLPDENE